MRIFEVTFKLSSGGAERFVVDLSNSLSKNHEVSLITIKNDEKEQSHFYQKDILPGINYINYNIPSGISIRGLITLYKLIKNSKPDIVHFHVSNIIVYFILPILFYRKCKYFETQHNDANFDVKKKSLYFFIRKFLYHYKFVYTCAISLYNKKTVEKVFNIRDCNIIVNGRIIPHPYNISNAVLKEIQKLKSAKDALCFIHIGRCVKQKNQELLINAFNAFNKTNKAILLIIGAGFESELGEKLQNISNENIYFLGEKLNVYDYLACADAFCLSSIYEGMPITLIESFSCGCIPISTPVSGCIDYIIDGENGFLAKDFSLDSYIDTLLRFKENKFHINKSRLIQTFEQNFSMDLCVNKYIDWFNESI